MLVGSAFDRTAPSESMPVLTGTAQYSRLVDPSPRWYTTV